MLQFLWVTDHITSRFDSRLCCRGRLPERLFLGCGTKEYSATRDHERPEIDALLLHYYHGEILGQKVAVAGIHQEILLDKHETDDELSFIW